MPDIKYGYRMYGIHMSDICSDISECPDHYYKKEFVAILYIYKKKPAK